MKNSPEIGTVIGNKTSEASRISEFALNDDLYLRKFPVFQAKIKTAKFATKSQTEEKKRKNSQSTIGFSEELVITDFAAVKS